MTELQKKMMTARVKYNITASFMGKILGLGPNQWRNYEAGSKPHRSKENLISIALTPMGFKRLLDNSPKYIKQHKKYASLYTRVKVMVDDIKYQTREFESELNDKYLGTTVNK